MAGPDYDSHENPVIGRIGIVNADDIEFGAESTWYGSGMQGYGAYAMQQFQAIDLLGSKQYIGGHAAIIDSDETGNMYGFISGVIVPVRGNIETIVEYQYNEYQDALREHVGTDDAHKVFAGLRIRF
jgi:hypothetical protein